MLALKSFSAFGRSKGSANLWFVGLWTTLLAGAVLQGRQVLGLASMWRDEVALGLNLDDRGPWELLTRPLNYQQMAPPGFLAALKTVTRLLGGPHAPDPAFRLLPWLLGLAGLTAAFVVLRRLTTGWPLVLGLLPFALGTGSFYYAAAVKPYGTDVAVCLLLLWAGLRHLEQPSDGRAALQAGWLCGPALLFSFPAVALAGFLAGLLGFHAWRADRHSNQPSAAQQRLGAWLRLSVPWGFFAATSALFGLHLRDRPIHHFMLDYWRAGFPPLDRPLEAVLWLPRHTAGVVQHFLFFRGPDLAATWLVVWMKVAVGVLLLLALWGFGSLVLRTPWRAAMLAMPLVVAALLAACRVYPYLERLGLWTVPSILLPAALALSDLWRRGSILRALAIGAGWIFALPILASSFWLQAPPTETQLLRPVIEELTRRVEPGDVIYVPCGGGQLGLRFYARRTGLDDMPVERVEGACHHNRAGYLAEASSLMGPKRLWLFHSHRPRGHAEWVLDFYLERGILLDQIDDPSGRVGLGSTRAFLFDFGAEPRRRIEPAIRRTRMNARPSLVD